MGVSEWAQSSDGLVRHILIRNSFCLDLSYLYSQLVKTYSRGVEAPENLEAAEGERDPLLPPGGAQHPHLTPAVRQFMAM